MFFARRVIVFGCDFLSSYLRTLQYEENWECLLYLILVQTGEEEADFVISEQDVSVVNQVSFEIKINTF